MRAIQSRLNDFQAAAPAGRLFQAAAEVFFPALIAGNSSGASVADELFQWPQRRSNGTSGATGRSGSKRMLRQRQRNDDVTELRDQSSLLVDRALRYADPAPTLAP